MKAWVIEKISDLKQDIDPLKLLEIPTPTPGPEEVLLQISACGICHTELDEIEGRTPPLSFPMIPGHQAVGKILELHSEDRSYQVGDRVGVGWIYDACGHCAYCMSGCENLCSEFRATGRDAHGGYAEFMTIPVSSAFKIPDFISDLEAAPLLCAGAIGYRSLNLSNLKEGKTLGLTGFGASGHLVLKIARHRYPDSKIVVFARSQKEREFAIELGAVWAGDIHETSPIPCDAIIDTTPVWTPVVEALRQLNPGGRLVINAIRKESGDQSILQMLKYSEHLWMEKEIKSVANITRKDISEFLNLVSEIQIRPEVEVYPFMNVNQALSDLKQGRICGAKVLQMV